MIHMLSKDDTVQLTFENEIHHETKCKYAESRSQRPTQAVYCFDSCRLNASRIQKARYQAKRRLRIKQKILVVDEYKKYGLGSYGTSANGHRKNKFSQEYIAIQKEMKRIGLKR